MFSTQNKYKGNDLIRSTTVKGTNKTDSVICFNFILFIITEFPIGVVNQYNNSWSNSSVLNKHFFFFV